MKPGLVLIRSGTGVVVNSGVYFIFLLPWERCLLHGAAQTWKEGGGEGKGETVFPTPFIVSFLICVLYPDVAIPHLEYSALMKVFWYWINVHIDVSGRGQILEIPILPSC